MKYTDSNTMKVNNSHTLQESKRYTKYYYLDLHIAIPF